MLAITDTGLTFTKDPFDRERYEDLRSLFSEMLNQVSDLDAEEVAEVLKPTSAYATPLMDIRAWIVEDEKVCLVRGKGIVGLCQVDLVKSATLQPKIFLKKLKKKPVLQQKLKGYLQFFDTNRFQLQSKQYAKFVFECQLLDGQFQENQEIADLQFFAIDQLPALSEKRITKEQMEILWQVYQGQREQYID